MITVHDCIWGCYPDGNYTFQAKRIRKVASEAEIGICPTDKTRRDAIKHPGLPIERMFVAHHGVPLFGRARVQERAVAKQGALLVPRWATYKNFTAVLLALAHLKNVNLYCLVGKSRLKRSAPY